ncbi:hypothetical protein [Metallosphaera sp.]|uniref:hypothetical protein n=1 Tax=Metallosphaera sp. TaxID=2020860 RepID=UPI003178F0C4
MSGWIYDPETGDYVSFEEYIKRMVEKERRKRVEELVDALMEVLTTRVRLVIDVRTGEVKAERR